MLNETCCNRMKATSSPRASADELNARISTANKISFVICLMPCVYLLRGALTGSLGANPVEELTHETGLWSLRLLWLSLCVTPLRRMTGWHWLIRLRRCPSLFCFFYACLHFLIYLVFEHEFDLAGIIADVSEKPYITAGGVAFLMLVPLAITSTDAMMRRLGGKNWRNLHSLVYPAAIAAAFHYLLLVKRDIGGPALYIVLLTFLFWLRLVKFPKFTTRAPTLRERL